MKNHIYSTLLIIAVILSSCDEEFLDKQPLDALSGSAFFNTSEDLKIYVNGFYEDAFPQYRFQGMNNNQRDDLGSDVLIFSANVTGSLNNIGSSGQAGVTSGTWNTLYDKIRRVNYFIANYEKVATRDIASNQYIGEAYFFRAWHYFDLLKTFGGVPFIEAPLNVEDEDLFSERESRKETGMRIIQDLDSAIANLSWKDASVVTSGRICKEGAIVMKSRVALYEGTWERYHNLSSSPYRLDGEDGTEFLQMIEPEIQKLISRQGSNIFLDGGLLNEAYNQYFVQTHGESTPGVYVYKVYDASILASSHGFHDNIVDRTGMSITDRLIEMYLDVDGVPQSASAYSLVTLNEKGQNLDPRFRQTIWTPDRGPMTGLPGRIQQDDFNLRYPVITNSLDPQFISTGYRRWKGAVLDVSRYRNGEADAIFIRYEEGLLAMAEAKAILGTITQTDIDNTVNVLRGRVGMTPMNLTDVNALSIVYNTTSGFDSGEPNIVNEIRRERTVELALEGFRLDDLKRWAVFEEAINGYKPKGALLQEFIDYFNDPSALTNDGWSGTDVTLTPGLNVEADENGFINPYFNNTQFQDGGEGFFIVGERDYLQPIPTGEIDLYKQRGSTLTQNPGWF